MNLPLLRSRPEVKVYTFLRLSIRVVQGRGTGNIKSSGLYTSCGSYMNLLGNGVKWATYTCSIARLIITCESVVTTPAFAPYIGEFIRSTNATKNFQFRLATIMQIGMCQLHFVGLESFAR